MNINPASQSQILKINRDEKVNSSVKSNDRKLTFENIRGFRQQFEKNAEPLLSVLGDDQHQTLIVAMYEGTEQLLNKDVSEFAVMEYLEGLKINAQELSAKNITGEQFQSSLLQRSDIAVRQLVHSS